MPTAKEARKHLQTLASPEDAAGALRFFKCGPGQYGEGDQFLGIKAAPLRQAAKQFRDLSFAELSALLGSPFHEERALALIILVLRFPKKPDPLAKEIFDFYLEHRAGINNWDLVDISAPSVVGGYLFPRTREPLDQLVGSTNLWDRRIAMVATQHFIRKGDFEDTLRLAKRLLEDPDDLMHKATGWMLREIGDHDEAKLEAFLGEYAGRMPRTMLRYAIEKLPEDRRRLHMAAPGPRQPKKGSTKK